jgi:hypothetical protein
MFDFLVVLFAGQAFAWALLLLDEHRERKAASADNTMSAA